MIAFNEVVFHISDQGQDYRKLGRWSFLTLTGKNELKTTIFTCYCPTRNSLPGSVFSQHLTYMAEHNNDMKTLCPRQLFGIDLKRKIEDRMALGHQIIVMGDFNSEYTKLNSWMMHLGLRDIIAKRHGPGPGSHERSQSLPIDCILNSITT